MSETMIERVARAIDKAMSEQYDPTPGYLARAAIEAMREPTAEMLTAAAHFPLHLVIERDDVDYTKSMETATAGDRLAARTTYQTMIDAALHASR